MPIRYRKIQSAFTSGEVSPRLLARTDLSTYNNAVKTMENFHVFTHGGATRRPGTQWIGEVRNSGLDVRMIPFVYSRTDSYVLVFNGGRIQFLKNGAFVESGGNRVEVTIPYTAAELPDITYAQYGSTMFLCHPNHAPRQLYRVTTVSWALEELEFIHDAIADYTYENAAVGFKIYTTGDGFDVNDSFTFTTNGSGVVTAGPIFTGTGTGGMTSITVNEALDVGATWTATCVFSSPTRQEFEVTRNVAPTKWTAKWAAGDYPTAVSFYEQRLYFAGSPSYPQTIWGTATGKFNQMTLGPLDDDAVEFTIASNRFDQILKLKSTRHLLPMTYGSEYSLTGSQSSGVTPSAVQIRSHTTHGTTNVEPLRVGEELLFVQRDGLKVRAISFDVTLDANIAPDITLLAEHITGEGIVDMTYAQAPDNIVWAVREDGTLLSCTHLRNQEVTAWARHTSGSGEFKHVVSLPTGNSDEVYVCVQRGSDQFIEILRKDFYMDSALEGTSGSPQDTWSGLDHLEGQEVVIRADGKVHPKRYVMGGEVTLEYEASNVQIGLEFIPTIELLHPEVLASDGTLQGATLSIYEAVLRVQDTIGLTINDQTVAVETTQSLMDSAPAPETGDLRVSTTGWKTPNNLKIEQLIPMPVTVLGVVIKLAAGE